MVNQLFGELANLEQVEAIALGGSRAGEFYDEKSDYDVYVYITSPISEETRRGILEKYCGYMEIGNQYWELEDNCVLTFLTPISCAITLSKEIPICCMPLCRRIPCKLKKRAQETIG